MKNECKHENIRGANNGRTYLGEAVLLYCIDCGAVYTPTTGWVLAKDTALERESTAKKNILLEANTIINGERQDMYGDPEDSFQAISEYWTTFLKHRHGFKGELTPLDTVNMMVLFKQARKLGQKPCRDNYIDSCGYEAIGADRLLEIDDAPKK